jgi:hypothetical protein
MKEKGGGALSKKGRQKAPQWGSPTLLPGVFYFPELIPHPTVSTLLEKDEEGR